METETVASQDQMKLIDTCDFTAVTQLMEQAVQDSVFPGAVLLVGRGGDVLLHESFGVRTQNVSPGTAQMNVDTVFDIASLTAVMVTTTLVMKLVESGKVQLDDRLTRYVQGFGVYAKSGVSIRHLLNHTGGLPAWQPFYEDLLKAHSGSRMGIITSRGARDYIINNIVRSTLKYPAGSKQVYSDVGLILLGFIVEMLSGLSLDKALIRYIVQPLGLRSTSFIDLAMIKRRGIHPVTDLIAPTEDCPWRKRVLCGEVHDDNAWAMGGIAGHSGLFSSAQDIHVYASEVLRAYHGDSTYLDRETLLTFWRKPTVDSDLGWLHGWDSPSRENNMLEAGFSPHAVGINGFTGCSLWIEPEANLDIVLLSNRVHPSRNNRKILNFRPELHRAILAATGLAH